MAELLLELFSEEIPSGAQVRAAEDFKRIFSAKFDAAGLSYKKLECYTTPRRVTIVADGLPLEQDAKTEERRGPRVDAPQPALDGFLKSTGLKLDQLEKRTTEKGEFYFAIIRQEGRKVSEFLSEAIQEIIASYTWPKSMKWGDNNIRWIRPLHSIICLFDGNVLPVSFGHIKAGNKTRGHRFLGNDEFDVVNFNDYKMTLRKHYVVLDQQERQKIIKEEAERLAKGVSASIKPDEGLLVETANLVEWPMPLLGKIEERFMSVPKEVLIVTMRVNQRYFSLLNNESLVPYFITVSNIIPIDGGAQIIHGNGRVLRARLEDAKFFWDQDKKNKLESRIPGLAKVIFHAKLGTVAEKVERIIALSKFIAKYVPGADSALAQRAAQLCKADLATGMVGEFPELQGLMGSYYAIHDKEDAAVANAIKEHYSPVGSSDSCPTAPVSAAVAISDKIDTLTGLFSIDEKPTGSRDPYALRRAALGVIRIILENNLRIPLKQLITESVNTYPAFKGNKEKLVAELLEFFADRLRVLLKEQDIRHDIIEAVFNEGGEDDLTRLVTRAKLLSSFLKTEDGINLLAAYKRATNIVEIEEKKDKTSYRNEPSESLLKEEPEKAVYLFFHNLRPAIVEGLRNERFELVMLELAKLRRPIDSFFDNVKVNHEDSSLRKNRLLLLSQFSGFLNNVANFSKLDG